MALTTFDVFVDVLQDLGVLNITTTTGASSKIALVDSKIAATYEDDEFNEGWAFCIRTSDGLAPQGEYVRISDYDGVTGTFTVDTFSANVDAGDTIGFINDEYPLRLMLERLNSALRTEKIGDLVLVDTSITTVSGQTEYTLPVGLKRKPIKVEIQTSTTSGDYEYQQRYDWQYIPAAAGSTGQIVFAADPIASRLLRIWYTGRHGTLSTYSSVINEVIPPEVVRYALLVEIMSWQNARNKGEDDYIRDEYNKYSDLLEDALKRWDHPHGKRVAKGILLTDSDTADEFYLLP